MNRMDIATTLVAARIASGNRAIETLQDSEVSAAFDLAEKIYAENERRVQAAAVATATARNPQLKK